jgi:hypothetical protein
MQSNNKNLNTAPPWIKHARMFDGLLLIVGMLIAILGSIMGSREVALADWILWALFAFVPALLLGLEAIITKEVTARLLILVGSGIKLSGNVAFFYGFFLISLAILGFLVAIMLIPSLFPAHRSCRRKLWPKHPGFRLAHPLPSLSIHRFDTHMQPKRSLNHNCPYYRRKR